MIDDTSQTNLASSCYEEFRF